MAGGFTQVPNAILRGEVPTPDGKTLSLAARVLYALILDCSTGRLGVCTARQDTLGRRLDLTPRQVYTLQEELKRAGLIRVEREGRGVTNTITPLLLPDRNPTSDHLRNLASDKQEPLREQQRKALRGGKER